MSVNHFSTATELLKALASKEVSSAELTEMYITRIETYDPTLNAIAVPTFDRAREMAKAADEKIAAGQKGALLGLPMTLKESTLVAGLPQTAGLEAFKGYLPPADGRLAEVTFAESPALLGKTNIPVALGDWQADSPVYGRSNNPFNLERTPGGSTGGGGAALAAGLTSLELGSDIGGSIRVPAAYCGVYGHRPSETAIPKSGAFPMADQPNAVFLLGVQGPLARSASDLELYFDVLAGPEPGEDVAWQLHIPPSRHDSLKDFRVGVLNQLGDVRPSSQMSARLDELAGFLGKQGAAIEMVTLPFDVQEFISDYVSTLMVMTEMATPPEARQQNSEALRGSGWINEAMANGLTMDAQSYVMMGTKREFYRAAYRELFTEYDVIITPTALDSAFPHNSAPQYERSLTIDNEEVNYFHNIFFPSLAIFTGQPATAFPAGFDSEGMPLGLQAIGPYLEDRTTLRFAQLLEQSWHKFVAPTGY